MLIVNCSLQSIRLCLIFHCVDFWLELLLFTISASRWLCVFWKSASKFLEDSLVTVWFKVYLDEIEKLDIAHWKKFDKCHPISKWLLVFHHVFYCFFFPHYFCLNLTSRSCNNLLGSPLVNKLFPAVGIVIFTLRGLGPLMRQSRNIFLHVCTHLYLPFTKFFLLFVLSCC